MDMIVMLLSGIIIFLASFFATVTGFGFALVATPLLSLVMDTKEAIVFVLVITVLLRALTMYRVWGQFDWNTVLMTTLGSIFGMIPGSLALKIMPVARLEIFLGCVLIAATYLMSRQYYVKISSKTAGRLGAGVLSGFFGAATSVSGPPLVLYFLNEKTEKTLMRANMIWMFGLSGFLMVIASYWAGNVSSVSDWSLMLSMVPGVIAGIFAGERLFYRLNQHLFRRIALIIVCGGAVMMLCNGISNL